MPAAGAAHTRSAAKAVQTPRGEPGGRWAGSATDRAASPVTAADYGVHVGNRVADPLHACIRVMNGREGMNRTVGQAAAFMARAAAGEERPPAGRRYGLRRRPGPPGGGGPAAQQGEPPTRRLPVTSRP